MLKILWKMDAPRRREIVAQALQQAIYKQRMNKCLKILKSHALCNHRLAFHLWAQVISNSIMNGETKFLKLG